MSNIREQFPWRQKPCHIDHLAVLYTKVPVSRMRAQYISTGMDDYCNPYSNRGMIWWDWVVKGERYERRNILKINTL